MPDSPHPHLACSRGGAAAGGRSHRRPPIGTEAARDLAPKGVLQQASGDESSAAGGATSAPLGQPAQSGSFSGDPSGERVLSSPENAHASGVAVKPRSAALTRATFPCPDCDRTLTDDNVLCRPLGIRASGGTVTPPTAFEVTASCPFCDWTQTKTFSRGAPSHPGVGDCFVSMCATAPAEPIPVNHRPRLGDDVASLDSSGRLSVSESLLAAAGIPRRLTRCTVCVRREKRTVYIRLCRPGDWPDSERLIVRANGRARIRLGAALISLGFSPRRRPVGRYPAAVQRIHGFPVIAICFACPERDPASREGGRPCR